jgi:hypothetical protein
MFVNRQAELAFLNNVLTRRRPGPAQLLLLYGRRRVGKTALLRYWAAHSDLPYTYWVAEKEPAALQRRKLYAKLLGVSESRAPIFESWAALWEATAELLGDQRRILILDEFTYTAQADPAALSALQHAWDQHFEHAQLVIVLCGSHVQTMQTLLTQQSPLFGRMTGQWRLRPLSFANLRDFFPTWSAEERVALYAIAGGVPAYLNWLDSEQSLVDNIRKIMLAPGSMFLAETKFLLYDEVREPQTYIAILEAIGAGHHTLKAISNASLISTTNLPAYLQTLRALRLVERRLPATVRPAKRRTSRRGRYHLTDPFFRFYFRFLHPQQEDLDFDRDRVLDYIRAGLRAFVGRTAFEELSQQWVRQQGKAGQLPLEPEIVGRHWGRHVQIDVVGINWQRKELLLGECKWTKDPINRGIVRELIEDKTPKVLRDLSVSPEEWSLHHAFFSRHGFTEAARDEAVQAGALLVDLEMLDGDLAHA